MLDCDDMGGVESSDPPSVDYLHASKLSLFVELSAETLVSQRDIYTGE